MKMNPRFNKITASVLALVALVAFATPASAQSPSLPAFERFLKGDGVLRGVSAVSTEPKILVRYTGTNANGGTVTVAAGGDITFSQGAVGSSAVDATVECDSSIAASGSRSGIFDLSTPHANCDTLGEVVDLINNQGTNWLAVIVHGRRSDATDNVFITLSETAAGTLDGIGLLDDGTISLYTTQAFLPPGADKMPFYVAGSCASQRTCRTLKANPFEGKTTIVYSMTATNTSGGTLTHTLLCVAVKNSLSTGAEAVTSYAKASGATTVEDTWAPQPSGFACPAGQKAIARTVLTSTNTVASLYIAGHIY
jgi:hypothetical protein